MKMFRNEIPFFETVLIHSCIVIYLLIFTIEDKVGYLGIETSMIA